MGWFRRTVAPASRKFAPLREPEVHGLIERYGLTEWWLSTFTQQERRAIEGSMSDGYDYIVEPRIWPQSVLTSGRPPDFGRSITQFLAALAVDADRAAMISHLKGLRPRIEAKIRELGGHVRSQRETQQRSTEDEETFLLRLVDIEEEDALVRGGVKSIWGAAPAPYQALAKIYRSRKDYASEVAILERYLRAPRHHEPSQQITMRLARARTLQQEQAT